MNEKSDSPKKVSSPVRMSEKMLADVEIAAEKLDLPKTDVMRIALAIGLEDLRRIGYDLAGAIVDASNLRKGPLATTIPTAAKHSESLAARVPGSHAHPLRYAPGEEGLVSRASLNSGEPAEDSQPKRKSGT